VSLDSVPGRWLLVVAVLGSGIAFLDSTVVNVALPDIGRDLHASTSTLQWILNGYSPLAAGAASLPITALMLVGSAPAGALAQRIGPRIPLTVGPLVTALGLVLMSRIGPGDSYWSGVLPAVIVFGLGLTLVVAPVTATVMAAADERHSGIASGINTAVSHLAGRVNPGPGKTSSRQPPAVGRLRR
jgi:MFS family permease